MKYSILSTATLATVAGSVVATPIVGQQSHHQHKRAIYIEYVYVTKTVDIYGNVIGDSPTSTSISQVAAARPANSEVASQSTPQPTTTSVYVAPATTSVYAAPTTTSVYVAPTTISTSSPLVVETSSSAATASSSAPASSAAPASSGGINGDLAPFVAPSQDFQDGVIDCSTFPAGQGVIALYNLGFGGWSGIEHPPDSSTGGISTVGISTGGICDEGAYCSYACQPGMLKTQWPSSQPADGVSVGGLLCKNGKLYRTNTAASTLCEWGTRTATVVSELSQDVAICRTDYPGTENMVIPTVVTAGGSNILAVVNQSNYYQWEGKPTSAQYYVNNAGVSWEDGCVWGTPGSGIGNWAPLNFGAGTTGEITYLSLIPNPNNNSPANFNVKIVAAPGGNVNGECVYENGRYSGGSNGCTVALSSGEAQFVLYN